MVIAAIAIKSYYAMRSISPTADPLASRKVFILLFVLGAALLFIGIAVFVCPPPRWPPATVTR